LGIWEFGNLGIWEKKEKKNQYSGKTLTKKENKIPQAGNKVS